MADLPARPSLDHLRREARDLLRAAQSGDTAAADRIRAVSATQTLASAQLAVAREYGFASWARLKTAVEARTTDLARQADVFCEASIRDWTGRAVRMLAATPELAGYNFATSLILGDADRVRAEIARDPGLATRVDARTGWTALHAACASNWHRLDPARAGGLLAVVRIILDAGADPNGRTGGPRGPAGRRCAVRWPARPTRRSSRCCRSAAPCPTTTTCTWPGSAVMTTRACGCCWATPPTRPGSPRRRSPRRSASTTPRAYGCCWRPAPIPAATPTTTARRPRPRTRWSGRAVRPNWPS